MSDVVFLCPQCRSGRRLPAYAVDSRVRCLTCETSFASDGHLFDRAAWARMCDPFQARAVASGLGCEPDARKWRLWACSFARSAFDWCRNPWFRDALQLAERWADDGSAPRGVRLCQTELARIPLPPLLRGGDVERWETIDTGAGLRARQQREEFGWVQLAQRCVRDDPRLQPEEITEGNRPLAAALLRELIGNPFVARVWNPEWFTSTARDLAAHIYDRHDFGTLPILADALQDAGCDDHQVLNHCRTGGPHARGCWVLDAVLGKS